MCIENTLIDISHKSQLSKGEKTSLRLIAKDVKKLKAENKRLEEVLIEFGRHQPGCCQQYDKKYSCRCGWNKVEQTQKEHK